MIRLTPKLCTTLKPNHKFPNKQTRDQVMQTNQDIYLVGVEYDYEKIYTQWPGVFNFILSNGQRSKIRTNQNLSEKRLQGGGKNISTIRLTYDMVTYIARRIVFLDKKDEIMLDVGSKK